MNKIMLSVFALAAFITACEKDDHGPKTDNEAPQIELLSPLENATFKNGDTVRIKGRMWDNKDLHEAGVFVSNEHGNMMDCPMHVHQSKEHHFDTIYVIQKGDIHHGLKVRILAEDHDHNKNEKVVNLLLQ